jgi:hypothetical protein
MRITLPHAIAKALEPLFTALPLERAMAKLVVPEPGDAALVPIVENALRNPALASEPMLAAGLWLYVDQLDRSHKISQQHEDPTGSFWHGIMHRREGDFSNSHNWFRRVGSGGHEAMKRMAGYDAHRFVDDAESAHRRGEAPEKLVDLQRREWAALFAWCADAR